MQVVRPKKQGQLQNGSVQTGTGSETGEIQATRMAIDAFLTAIMGGAPVAKETLGMPTAGKGTAAESTWSPSLASLLQADGLARAIGANATNGWADESMWHLFWLKALESGGSEIKKENFLHTNVSYSGGAVGTYALFKLDGTMECAGNVYSYAGPVHANELKGNFPTTDFNATLEGGCLPEESARP